MLTKSKCSFKIIHLLLFRLVLISRLAPNKWLAVSAATYLLGAPAVVPLTKQIKLENVTNDIRGSNVSAIDDKVRLKSLQLVYGLILST